jgi:Ran GTPase-activating protein (RanGAP) involved in mRNA processing and transport
LKYDENLVFLNLANNNITSKGAESIAMLLEKNTCLRVLFLHWNKPQSKGGSLIAKALQANATLQVLDVSYCSLGPKTEKT